MNQSNQLLKDHKQREKEWNRIKYLKILILKWKFGTFDRGPYWYLCHPQLSLSLDLYIWLQESEKLWVPLKHAIHYAKWFYAFLCFAPLKFFLQITKSSLAEITLPLLMNSSASCSLEKPASTSTLTISHVDPAATCFCCVENLYIWWNSENSGL